MSNETKNKQLISYDPITNCLDVTFAVNPEIQIRHDGKVLWVNEGGRCLLRICRVENEIVIRDERNSFLIVGEIP